MIFQYILCYGSTNSSRKERWNGLEFQYILCYGSTKTNPHVAVPIKSISIHLMLWFNASPMLTFKSLHTFQYILCYGSTYMFMLGICAELYFNTSYVMVQHFKLKNLNLCLVHFNTSYVMVQLAEAGLV